MLVFNFHNKIGPAKMAIAKFSTFYEKTVLWIPVNFSIWNLGNGSNHKSNITLSLIKEKTYRPEDL